MFVRDNDAPLLLDASRLVWRRWTGTRATGIDRICLAWMQYYGPRAQAVIIHRQGKFILPFTTSQALFRLLAEPEHGTGGLVRFRAALAALAIRRSWHLRDRLKGHGRFWLNPGHTGLDQPGLAEWVRRRELRPLYLVHDLIPLTHPQFCREGEQERHHRRMLTVLETGAGVIANSAHTLATLGDFAAAQHRVPPPSTIAWPGIPVLPPAPLRQDVMPSFVILGTIEGRKNHALLLSAWRRMIAELGEAAVPRLVIVGRRGWQADEVFAQLDQCEFGDRVVEVGSLDDRRLALELAGARALLFPSFAEGYGIPLLEALGSGVPVIASDLPVFREIGQGIPELIDARNVEAWSEAILEYARPESVRRQRQIQLLRSYRAPTWQEHFRRVDDLINILTS